MTAAETVRMPRRRNELDSSVLARIEHLRAKAEDAQAALEFEIGEALLAGAPLNELSRQTGIAKTTLLRYMHKR